MHRSLCQEEGKGNCSCPHLGCACISRRSLGLSLQAAGWAQLLLPSRHPALLRSPQRSVVPLAVALPAHTPWSLCASQDLVQKMQFLNCICLLCSSAIRKGLTVSLDIFSFLNDLPEHIEVRGHGALVPAPCEEDRAGGEGGREIVHGHQGAPAGTPGVAETSAVEVDSSMCVPGLVKGHGGYAGPTSRCRVCWCWVLAAAGCHPGCALQVLLCEEPREQLTTALRYHCMNAIAALRYLPSPCFGQHNPRALFLFHPCLSIEVLLLATVSLYLQRSDGTFRERNITPLKRVLQCHLLPSSNQGLEHLPLQPCRYQVNS